jgi:hypothetical protein
MALLGRDVMRDVGHLSEDRLWDFETRQRIGHFVLEAVWGVAIPSTKHTRVPRRRFGCFE